METSQKTSRLSDVRARLCEAFAEAQVRRPNYSLRAFARDLNLPAPVVSEALRGKRKITPELGQKILSGLGLQGNLLESKPKDDYPDHVQLAHDEFDLVADWFHFAILSLSETDTFQSEPNWIARQLGISKNQAEKAIQTLLRLKLLEQKGNQWIPTGQSYSTTNEVASVAIRKNHAQGLELARQALHHPIELRDFAASTFVCDPADLPELKKYLRTLRLRAVKRAEKSKKKKQVYRLQMQLFALSQGDEK